VEMFENSLRRTHRASGFGLDVRPGWATPPLSGAGRVGSEAMPHAEALFDDGRDLCLLWRDGLLRLHRWHIGALVRYVMP